MKPVFSASIPMKLVLPAREALPIADPGVVAPAGRNDKKSAVASKTKLRQRAGEIRSPVGHDPKARHISCLRSCGVVTDNALDRPNIATPTVLPARLFSHFEAGVQQDFWQPSQ